MSTALVALTAEQAEQVLRRTNDERGPVGYDTETRDWAPGQTPVHRATVVCFSLAGDGWKAVIDGEFFGMFRHWLGDEGKVKITANDKFEQHVAANHHMVLRGTVLDTVLASYTLDPHLERAHSVEAAAKRHLGDTKRKFREVCPDGDAFRAWMMDRDSFAEYSMDDAYYERLLGLALIKKLEDTPWRMGQSYKDYYDKYVMPFSDVLFEMERHGVLVDPEKVNTSIKRARLVKDKVALKIVQELGWVPSRVETFLASPAQLVKELYEKRGLQVKKFTPGGQCLLCGRKTTKATGNVCPQHPTGPVSQTPSTSSHALEGHKNDPLVKNILLYRLVDRKDKELVGLLEQIHPHTKRIHTNYGQASARTGRLASTAPNLQNVSSTGKEKEKANKAGYDPFNIRDAFYAEPGSIFIDHDENQLEYRIMAHLSQDKSLVEGFFANKDFHTMTAEAMSVPRPMAKNANFCLNYGGGARKLAETLNVSLDEARAFIEKRKQGLPGLYAWWEQQHTYARANGHVYNIMMWRRPVPDINSEDDVKAGKAFRIAVNTPVQSAAAEIVKCSMLKLLGPRMWKSEMSEKYRATGAKMLLQIHDELLQEVPQDNAREAAEITKEAMEHPLARELRVPLVVEWGMGTTWAEAH